MNHQVGDHVRVKTMQELASLYGKPYQGPCGATVTVPGGMNFVAAMEPYGGKVLRIRSRTKVGYYLDGVQSGYCFTDAMLDKVIGV